MEILVGLGLLLLAVNIFRARGQRRRIALLGSHLGNFQIEKLMERLTDGYLRCLDEADPERRAQIWNVLAGTEQDLSAQFRRFADGFARVDATQARVSKLPLADPLFPSATFDARQAFAIHARGIENAAANRLGLEPKAKAFMMSAELFLMQHTCHWFCRSKTVASARLLARHKTSYQLALDSVSPATRAAYLQLVGGRSD
ncbi:hypothetical protein QTI66_37135 [Variovorax sp. J22R133]|uniref:hypothetical protein n=1 Tax=Variovorax brevis TaxID=3053503 RepID=UPI002574F131|nr:hypothetical protein [Variovorax sp. J22R133]MDM0117732.1 hypothetical protein [Variovorax sp. J22R133]